MALRTHLGHTKVSSLSLDSNGATAHTTVDYLESCDVSATLTGALTGQTVTVNFNRFGDVVRVTFPNIVGTMSNSTNGVQLFINGTAPIPSRFRPSADRAALVSSSNAGTPGVASITAFANGDMKISAGPAPGVAWGTGAASVIYSQTFTYKL